MTSKERMLTALRGGTPDRLPVTTHHVMEYFLNHYLGGIDYHTFFDRFDLDAYDWTLPFRSVPGVVEVNALGFTCSESWRIESEVIPGVPYQTTRHTIHTPKGKLSMTLQSNEHTAWVVERPVKEKGDIALLEFMPDPLCDVQAVNATAQAFGERGLVRGHIPGFDIYGQPGTWQDASCLYGIENLIFAAFDDPAWVDELLGFLRRRKEAFIRSLKGANYDLLELGGGDASSTVISPKLFDRFVAPHDSILISLAHENGQRIVYHTCGGMMPILEHVAAMHPDAMETFTPVGMGGDMDLAEAKRRIGDQVCFIGGFDQFHYFLGCTPQETRTEVRRCFETAGVGGGYILSPSDHFFDADLPLLEAFADEAHKCLYV
jgi:uroporphyrinogen decarboxylase